MNEPKNPPNLEGDTVPSGAKISKKPAEQKDDLPELPPRVKGDEPPQPPVEADDLPELPPR